MNSELKGVVFELSLQPGTLYLKEFLKKKNQTFVPVCCHETLFALTVFFCLATVLLTLRLAVELVGVILAEVHFVGHAQTGGGVESPDGRLT